MKFKSKAQALYYIGTHSIAFQRRMKIVATRVWNSTTEDWEPRWVVVIEKEDAPRHCRRDRRQKLRI
jgi:hypothetical protein